MVLGVVGLKHVDRIRIFALLGIDVHCFLFVLRCGLVHF
jgi:hypothetical protein